MTPANLAKLHCANYDTRDSSCAGIYYNRDLTIQASRPLPKCLLNEPCRRCSYFEEIIMPLYSNLTDSERSHPKLKNSILAHKEGVKAYMVAVNAI